MTLRETRPRPGAPALQRTTMGCSSATFRGTWTNRPSAEWLRANWANLSFSGRFGAPSMSSALEQLRPIAQDVGERVHDHAGGARSFRQATCHDAVLGHLDERSRPLRNDIAHLWSVTRLCVRLDLRPARRPQVAVQREERVWLDGQLGIELVAC